MSIQLPIFMDHITMNHLLPKASVIVVARHGERLDYFTRDNPNYKPNEINWVATAERPFDPPLTDHGKEQAKTLGRHLTTELSKLNLPSVSEIYTSPLLRCRQTACSVRSELGSTSNEASVIPVRVEPGLVESINECWYRSWALPGSDGTWGYCIDDKAAYDVKTIHPMAKQPVQELLEEWKSDVEIDQSYTPKTSITAPYTFDPPCLESSAAQRQRMKEVVTQVHEPGQTIMLVSHGGPVTHLFEELMGQSWLFHGEATYCSYSIYKRIPSEKGVDTWEAIQINQSKHLHEMLVAHRYISDGDP
jgi:broad specificity phosphatase PhoE